MVELYFLVTLDQFNVLKCDGNCYREDGGSRFLRNVANAAHCHMTQKRQDKLNVKENWKTPAKFSVLLVQSVIVPNDSQLSACTAKSICKMVTQWLILSEKCYINMGLNLYRYVVTARSGRTPRPVPRARM
jgi:hypothetical protein